MTASTSGFAPSLEGPNHDTPKGYTLPGRKPPEELVQAILEAQRHRDERAEAARLAGDAGGASSGLAPRERVERYVVQNGVRRLTPKQARRTVQKRNKRSS